MPTEPIVLGNGELGGVWAGVGAWWPPTHPTVALLRTGSPRLTAKPRSPPSPHTRARMHPHARARVHTCAHTYRHAQAPSPGRLVSKALSPTDQGPLRLTSPEPRTLRPPSPQPPAPEDASSGWGLQKRGLRLPRPCCAPSRASADVHVPRGRRVTASMTVTLSPARELPPDLGCWACKEAR